MTAQPVPCTMAMSRRVRVVSCPIMAAGQRLSISFVLASLRALHIDNRKCPPAKNWRLSNDAQVHATTQDPHRTSASLLPAIAPTPAHACGRPTRNYPQPREVISELIHSPQRREK